MLDLLDLLVDKPEMCHSTLQLRQCVGRNDATLRRPQPRKPFRCFAQFRVEAADTEANQRRFHAVNDAGAFSNQLLALAGRALGTPSWSRGCGGWSRSARPGATRPNSCAPHVSSICAHGSRNL